MICNVWIFAILISEARRSISRQPYFRPANRFHKKCENHTSRQFSVKASVNLPYFEAFLKLALKRFWRFPGGGSSSMPMSFSTNNYLSGGVERVGDPGRRQESVLLRIAQVRTEKKAQFQHTFWRQRFQYFMFECLFVVHISYI